MSSPFENHDAAPISLGSEAYQNATPAPVTGITDGSFTNAPAGQSSLTSFVAFNENALPIGIGVTAFNNAVAEANSVGGDAAQNENALPIGGSQFAFQDHNAAPIGTPIAAAISHLKDEAGDTFVDPETGGQFTDPS